MRRPTTAAAIVLAIVSAAALTGCTAGNPAPSPTPLTTRSADAVTSTCVPNPKAVVDRKPAKASTGPMPAKAAAPIAAAAAAGFAASHSPGAVVAVRTRKGTWIKAFGLADIATKEAMPADVHQRIGSLTKTFTSTLLMQLVAQGKVSLDDPISKYVSGVPNGKKITILDLATMRSGLADYTNDTNGNPNLILFGDTSRAFTVNQLLTIALADPPLAAPNTTFHYTNTNYVLLQKVVEKVTGSSWNTLLATRILDPLHLTQTSYPGLSATIPEPFAQGYTPFNTPDPVKAEQTGTLSNSTHWNPSWGAGAGEMISTAGDLLTWSRHLVTGQGVLPASAQIQRLRSFRPADAINGNYGIGLTCSSGWVGHTGLIPGYNTLMRYNVTADATVVVETNTDFPATITGEPLMAVMPMFEDVAKALGHPDNQNGGEPPAS